MIGWHSAIGKPLLEMDGPQTPWVVFHRSYLHTHTLAQWGSRISCHRNGFFPCRPHRPDSYLYWFRWGDELNGMKWASEINEKLIKPICSRCIHRNSSIDVTYAVATQTHCSDFIWDESWGNSAEGVGTHLRKMKVVTEKCGDAAAGCFWESTLLVLLHSGAACSCYRWLTGTSQWAVNQDQKLRNIKGPSVRITHQGHLARFSWSCIKC